MLLMLTVEMLNDVELVMLMLIVFIVKMLNDLELGAIPEMVYFVMFMTFYHAWYGRTFCK